MRLSSKFLPIAFLITSIVLLIVKKIPVLNLPHYWDEAFPYSYAIGYMSQNGSSLLSDCAPSLHTTGHPLLYYFMQSTWNNIVGNVIWMERLFPMIVSILILIFTYLIGKKLHSKSAGGIATILLSTQSSFLSQASFQLPETMLTLFLLMSIYYTFTNKKWPFVLVATGMVFTKETGVILLFILFLNFIISSYNKTERIHFIKSTWIYVTPIALNFLFYLHQYYVQGWFFFPRHTGFIISDIDPVFDQFSRYFANLFIFEGRNMIFFAMLIITTIIGISRWKAMKIVSLNHSILILISLIIGFLTFSAFNFYSDRYILCLFPIFVILASLSITALFKKRVWISSALGLGLTLITFAKSYTNTKPTDHSLGYSDAVITQMNAINYCVNMKWQKKSIQTGFLTSKNLTSHYPRYLERDQLFSNVNKTNSSPELIIISNNEIEEHLMKKINNFYSVKRFENGNQWCEIFARKKNINMP